MIKIINLALITAFSFAVLVPAASAARSADWCDDTINNGVHPWDVRPRRHYEYSRVDPYRYAKDYFYLHPDRSVTHALHPYHRKRYYAPPIDPEAARYSSRRISDVRYSEERAYVPSVNRYALCESYTYQKPNYRVPPYEYYCNN